MADQEVLEAAKVVGQICPVSQVGQVGQQPYRGLSLSHCPGALSRPRGAGAGPTVEAQAIRILCGYLQRGLHYGRAASLTRYEAIERGFPVDRVLRAIGPFPANDNGVEGWALFEDASGEWEED